MLHIENKFENVEWTSIKKKKLYKRKEGRKIKQKEDPEEVDEPYKCWLFFFLGELYWWLGSRWIIKMSARCSMKSCKELGIEKVMFGLF